MAIVDSVFNASFEGPADSARTAGGAVTRPQVSRVNQVTRRSTAQTFDSGCPTCVYVL